MPDTGPSRLHRRRRWPLIIVVVIGAACSAGDGTLSSPTTDPATVTSTSAPAAVGDAGEPALDYAGELAGVEPLVEAIVDDAGIGGAGLVVVDGDDGLVYEAYWGGFGPERVSLIASTSKSITATVLLHLHDDGVLDIDEPIASYVPWAAANPEITIAQLLSNSSGLVGLIDNPAYPPYLCQFVGDEIEACGEQILTTDADDADVVAPDTRFRYGGAQWQVAGAVAEAVSGKPWARLVQEILVEPCGLTSLGYNNHFTVLTSSRPFGYPDGFDGDPSVLPPTENPSMEGGAYISPRDYAALLEMFLGGGRCGSQQILSPTALNRLFTDRVAAVYDGDAGSPGAGYGMGFFVDRSTGRVNDPGLYGARSWLDLDAGYGAYLVIEADGGTSARILAAVEDPIHDALTSGR